MMVLLAIAGVCAGLSAAVSAPAPRGIAIDHAPQLFVDDHLVDNRWGLQEPTETVLRVAHAPRKDARNPVIAGDGGYVNVVRDEAAGLFRMWYQAFWDQSLSPRRYTYGTAYAESADGIHWRLPRIGRYVFRDTRDNNIVHLAPGGGDAGCQFILDIPEDQRRGHRYVLLYTTYERGSRGMHLIGSQDGITWDPASDVRIAPEFVPDTQNSIVWDPASRRFVCFTRAVNLYEDGESGPRRRVARMESARLWDPWPVHPENILIPDEQDVAHGHPWYYGMPVKHAAGMFWGCLWLYQPGGEIVTELAYSRDGRAFHRLPARPRLIDTGPPGAWDHGMVFGSRWLEVGDEWWFYYSGTNAGHGERDPRPGIGLARLRREGFVSLRSPAGGGVVVTRLLRWPGGRLAVNADAAGGELSVRVTGADRRPIAGCPADPSLPLRGDRVRHEVRWAGGDVRLPRGKAIRLEFAMKGVVDLYGFRAVPDGERP